MLRAFGKRKEFTALVAAAPVELRRPTPTSRPLTFDTKEDLCSRPVCVSHSKAISEMGKNYKAVGSSLPASKASANTNTTESVRPGSPAASSLPKPREVKAAATKTGVTAAKKGRKGISRHATDSAKSAVTESGSRGTGVMSGAAGSAPVTPATTGTTASTGRKSRKGARAAPSVASPSKAAGRGGGRAMERWRLDESPRQTSTFGEVEHGPAELLKMAKPERKKSGTEGVGVEVGFSMSREQRKRPSFSSLLGPSAEVLPVVVASTSMSMSVSMSASVSVSGSAGMGIETAPMGAMSPLDSLTSNAEMSVAISAGGGGRGGGVVRPPRRQQQQPQTLLPPYSSLRPDGGGSVGGGDNNRSGNGGAGGGTLTPISPPDAGEDHQQQVMRFPEVLRQVQVPWAGNEWDVSSASDMHRRVGTGGGTGHGSFADEGGGRVEGDMDMSGGAVSSGMGLGMADATASLLLSNLRMDHPTSVGVPWGAMATSRRIDGRAAWPQSMRHLQSGGGGGVSGEPYFNEPFREHFEGDLSADELMQRQQQVAMELGGGGGGGDSNDDPLSVSGGSGQGQGGPAPFLVTPNTTALAGSGGTDLVPPRSQQRWTTLPSPRRISSNDTTSSSCNGNSRDAFLPASPLPQQPPPPPPLHPPLLAGACGAGGDEGRGGGGNIPHEGVTPVWPPWTSSPQLITSPAPAPSSAIPPPPSHYGPASSSIGVGQLPSQCTRLSVTPISSSGLPISSHRSPRSLGVWSAGGGEGTSIIAAAAAAASAAAVAASTVSSTSVRNNGREMAGRVAMSTAGRGPGGADGGPQEDNMLMELWELMDNGPP